MRKTEGEIPGFGGLRKTEEQKWGRVNIKSLRSRMERKGKTPETGKREYPCE